MCHVLLADTHPTRTKAVTCRKSRKKAENRPILIPEKRRNAKETITYGLYQGSHVHSFLAYAFASTFAHVQVRANTR